MMKISDDYIEGLLVQAEQDGRSARIAYIRGQETSVPVECYSQEEAGQICAYLNSLPKDRKVYVGFECINDIDPEQPLNLRMVYAQGIITYDVTAYILVKIPVIWTNRKTEGKA